MVIWHIHLLLNLLLFSRNNKKLNSSIHQNEILNIRNITTYSIVCYNNTRANLYFLSVSRAGMREFRSLIVCPEAMRRRRPRIVLRVAIPTL